MSEAEEEAYTFRHDVNPATAALTVRVVVDGPFSALKHTFFRSATGPPPDKAAVESQERKTVGFLAIVGTPAASRIVKWAQSGHSHGRNGEVLAEDDRTLPNKIWARRAIAMANLLGFPRTPSFDNGLRRDLGEGEAEELKGIYKYSHVEVKLAVHAIYLVLRDFLPQAREPFTMDQLKVLKRARWSDGSKPEFRIVVSRMNCGNCKKMLDKLYQVTGVKFHPVIGQRVENYKYEQQVVHRNKRRRDRDDEDGSSPDEAPPPSHLRTRPDPQTPPAKRIEGQAATPQSYPEKYLPGTPVYDWPTVPR
ncbi:hypothetical protein GQ602_005972 [Ophiocordyceps camponoti-floridani]|uniref:Uncharacterized protein n=1 Tax=Ophiocordyceps camponoti-floridani TaxID=2030778 RepID=A0A8H4Q2E5_9HYPO|nr:hypothetical protein GQ602_005972 [Ophiocordyceps camponoti-floridani]